MQPLTFKAQCSLPHTQVGLILAGNSNKGTQRTLWLEECSVASPLMSPCWHGLCGKAVGTQEPPACGMWVPHLDVGLYIRYDKHKRQELFGLGIKTMLYLHRKDSTLRGSWQGFGSSVCRPWPCSAALHPRTGRRCSRPPSTAPRALATYYSPSNSP